MVLTASNDKIPDRMKYSKGIYPYSLPKTFSDLTENRDSLQSLADVYDVISENVSVSESEHEIARHAWITCRCKSLKDYMMRYLRLDVYQLADIFNAYRKMVIAEDGLEPLNYYGISGLSWDAAIKSTRHTPLDQVRDSYRVCVLRGFRKGWYDVCEHASGFGR